MLAIEYLNSLVKLRHIATRLSRSKSWGAVMGVDAEAREGEFGQVGLAQADQPGAGGAGQQGGVGRGNSPGEDRRRGGGRCAGAVEQVLPGNRHAVERPAAQSLASPPGGGPGLAPGALGGDMETLDNALFVLITRC